MQLLLQDHPDGVETPPPYGLRLDNLFVTPPTTGSVTGGVGGHTTFTFNETDDVFITVEEMTASEGNPFNIHIAGTVFGGVDTGDDYGFGEGFYDIEFNYTQNVIEVPGPEGGFIVTDMSSQNFGTITAQAGITGVAPGTTWTLFDKTMPPNSFELLRDGYRLSSQQVNNLGNPLVGRGWMMYENGSFTTGGQDWIFVAIPEPTTLGLVTFAFTGLALRRRR